MGDNYENLEDILAVRVTPLVGLLCRLSDACVSFSSAAVNVAHTDVTETHEIKELLDLVFDTRKMAEKVEDVLEDRLEEVLKSLKKEDCD